MVIITVLVHMLKWDITGAYLQKLPAYSLSFSYECSNPIDGVTLHPLDSERSPGGSSGGEGALIGAGGSLLGFGSDLGGSIRVPAYLCGICGLKPGSKRVR